MIISVTPDLALDVGYTYAGGLGVLEGDKFYAAAQMGLPYRVLTFLYPKGYADYVFDSEDKPIVRPQPQPPEFLSQLRPDGTLNVNLNGTPALVEVYDHTIGTAKAVFFKAVEPDWAARLAERVYVWENDEEKFYAYVLLAKSAAEYISSRIGLGEIEGIYLQEAYTCFLPLVLKAPEKYRYVIHTAGVWGHPSFPKEYFKKEFNYDFISSSISLTEVGLAASNGAFTVSRKHSEVMTRILPHFSHKLKNVTNGVNIDRWMHPDLKTIYENNSLTLTGFIQHREAARRTIADLIKSVKDVDIGDRLIVSWCRRIVQYKRPEIVIKAIEEIPQDEFFFILGGKAHPNDAVGLEYMRTFRKLHNTRNNVAYLPNYDITRSKQIHASADLILFTPLQNMEACGTSYMKAALNGIPTLASRDGGALECIIDGVNGWFFGGDYEIDKGPSEPDADYQDARQKLIEIAQLRKKDKEKYYAISLNALTTCYPKVDVRNALTDTFSESND
jgi:starch phosphorylase